jgi:protein-S-isoprenylcysteine O-methyltransferase Ste14
MDLTTTPKEKIMTSATDTYDFEQDSPDVNLMPPRVFVICLLSGGFMEMIFPTHLPWLRQSLWMVLGFVVGTAGFAFMMLAHEKFKKAGTNVPTNLPATTFIAQGAYRYSRNPMYVGGSAWFLGMGLLVGSVWMIITYLPLGLYLSFFVIPREEAYMERTFGHAYKNYCQRVGRWL